jgi:signal transduction histidine kinase
MLGAQAAIAIANARLYRALEGYSKKLEEQVKDRTRAAEQAQQAAETASSAKSAFLASMSHELRTPMNAILGFTKIVLRRSGDTLPAQQRENLEKVVTSGNHLLALINDVLDLSKIEAGRMDLRLADLPLLPLARECVSMTSSLAEARAQRLSLEAEGDVTAHADGDKVREILLNLIGNAVKFTKEGGSVVVRCYAKDAGACLAVEDSGVGIAKESLEDVFVEFWQHGGGTSRQSGGTGLGLAISRKLARAMGGDVTVESELGRGSTFTLCLPDPRAARAGSGAAPEGGASS